MNVTARAEDSKQLLKVKTCARCQTSYTLRQYLKLEPTNPDTTVDDYASTMMVYRNCTCRSTLAVEFKPCP